jgi:glyoxylase-like metal-dependent hydrolase (beta-lactamase superfamily II)
VIVERVEHPEWLSNAYLLADRPGGRGVLVDSNGLEDELVDRAREDGIAIDLVLCTHGHADHVVAIEELARRVGAPLVAHPDAPVAADIRVTDGEALAGALPIRALYTPGHAADHVSYVVAGTHCLTGDVLFAGTVGGSAGPSGDYDALRRSVLDVLLGLPDETVVLPGHREATTVGAERATNPFVRAWTDGDALGGEPVTVGGRPATLLLWAPDYDGGNKALVRFDDGREQVVGGSRVARA